MVAILPLKWRVDAICTRFYTERWPSEYKICKKFVKTYFHDVLPKCGLWGRICKQSGWNSFLCVTGATGIYICVQILSDVSNGTVNIRILRIAWGLCSVLVNAPDFLGQLAKLDISKNWDSRKCSPLLLEFNHFMSSPKYISWWMQS